jgi:N-methylhydantoinase A
VIPPLSGVFSALGMLTTEPRTDVVRTQIVRADQVDAGTLEEIFAELERHALTQLAGEVTSAAHIVHRRAIDIRYEGQEHTVRVSLDGATRSLAAIEQRFHAQHEQKYTFSLPDAAVELVTFHVASFDATERVVVPSFRRNGRSARPAAKGRRLVDFDSDGVHETPVYERAELPPGISLDGPLVIEEPSSTALVRPGQFLEVDDHGNLLIRFS